MAWQIALRGGKEMSSEGRSSSCPLTLPASKWVNGREEGW